MADKFRRMPEYSCHVCGGEINSWDWRISMALGYDHPTCEKCIATEYDHTVDELRDQLEEFFGMKPCVGI